MNKKAIAATIVIVIGGGFYFYPRSESLTVPSVGTPIIPELVKTVKFTETDESCRFAVRCGGVHSLAEFKNLLSDPIIGYKYRMLDSSHLREIRLDHDMYAYVMYRVGDDLYYTKKRVLIHKGEMVLTDGNFMVLERCGNLFMTSVPLSSPSLENEPFLPDTPPPVPDDTNVPVFQTPASVAAISTPSDVSGEGTYGSAYGGYPCCGFIAVSAPVSTPEPSSFGMLLMGFLGLGLFGYSRREK